MGCNLTGHGKTCLRQSSSWDLFSGGAFSNWYSPKVHLAHVQNFIPRRKDRNYRVNSVFKIRNRALRFHCALSARRKGADAMFLLVLFADFRYGGDKSAVADAARGMYWEDKLRPGGVQQLSNLIRDASFLRRRGEAFFLIGAVIFYFWNESSR